MQDLTKYAHKTATELIMPGQKRYFMQIY